MCISVKDQKLNVLILLNYFPEAGRYKKYLPAFGHKKGVILF